MSARQLMTMRATVQRNIAGIDTNNRPKLPEWRTIHNNLPCYVWETNDRKIYGTSIVDISGPIMIFPKNEDLKSGDRIISVIDRGNNILFTNLKTKEPIFRRNHKQVELEKIA